MEANGFSVEVHDQSDMAPIKTSLGVPMRLQSCHTAKIGDYVVEGHVPATEVKRLLSEKPPIKGLSVPGMVTGSPGMEGARKDPYHVVSFTQTGELSIYSSHNQ